MDDILSLAIPMVLAVCVVIAIRIVEDARLRRRLAETHATEEVVKAILASDVATSRSDTRKWGVVLLAIGLAFVAVQLLGLGADDPAAFGVVFVGAGLGLLLFNATAKSG